MTSPESFGDGEERFTIRPAGAGGFVAVEVALARKLAARTVEPGRTCVILSIDNDRNHFTQALVDRRYGAWVEAVSNTFVMPGGELDDDQHALLATLGFEPPDTCPNHSLVVEPQADWSEVAAILVHTLVAVYGASPFDALQLVLFAGNDAPFMAEKPVAPGSEADLDDPGAAAPTDEVRA